MNNVPLSTLQQWMQAVIEHPGSTSDALRSDEASAHLPPDEGLEAIVNSGALSPAERIGIYRKMFFLRMTESMAIDYPGVKAFLGEERFDRLIADEYVKQYPSSSYTLNHLGRNFPAFLRASALPEREMLADLAELELAVTNSLDAAEMPLLGAERIAAIPPEGWGDVTFVPIQAVSVLTLGHSVADYLDAVINDDALPVIQRRSTHILIYRRTFRTYWEELTPQQYRLLSLLLSGMRFGDALAALADAFPIDASMQNDIFHWFGDWVGKGLFSDIHEHSSANNHDDEHTASTH